MRKIFYFITALLFISIVSCKGNQNPELSQNENKVDTCNRIKLSDLEFKDCGNYKEDYRIMDSLYWEYSLCNAQVEILHFYCHDDYELYLQVKDEKLTPKQYDKIGLWKVSATQEWYEDHKE